MHAEVLGLVSFNEENMDICNRQGVSVIVTTLMSDKGESFVQCPSDDRRSVMYHGFCISE